MTFHLFGNVLTRYGAAANNRGENEGNITTLQKLLWKGQVHTTVSAEAIRWALRYHWQINGATELTKVNRQWSDADNDNRLLGEFSDETFIDDDVLGFMRAEGAKEEANDEPKTKGKKPKGTTTARRGVLEVTRAVSTTPYSGDITFNAKSGQKGRTSLYGTEVHATRYQYGFAMTPSRLAKPERVLPTIDGLISLGEVAGNHSRFLYDFSPESIVLRWTHDFSPRFLYCFEETEDGEIGADDLIARIDAGDLSPDELFIAGSIVGTSTGEQFRALGVKTFPGIKAAVSELKKRIATDVEL